MVSALITLTASDQHNHQTQQSWKPVCVLAHCGLLWLVLVDLCCARHVPSGTAVLWRAQRTRESLISLPTSRESHYVQTPAGNRLSPWVAAGEHTHMYTCQWVFKRLVKMTLANNALINKGLKDMKMYVFVETFSEHVHLSPSFRSEYFLTASTFTVFPSFRKGMDALVGQ